MSTTTENGTIGTINYQDYIAEQVDKTISHAVYYGPSFSVEDDDTMLKKAQNKVTAINRERQIDNILHDIPFEPIKIEAIEEYQDYLSNRYSTYLSENLNKSICYADYSDHNLDEISYSEYITEQITTNK